MANMSHQSLTKKKTGHSNSLWNVAISPGWSDLEYDLLRVGVMKFGIGRWNDITKSNLIGTKLVMPCYLQLQRQMGQQSLAGFMGLHVDIDAVSADNAKKEGVRKYGTVLINMGDKLTKEKKEELKIINKKKFGLPQEYIDTLILPKPESIRVYEIYKILNSRTTLSSSEKIVHLNAILKNLERKLSIIDRGGTVKAYSYVRYADWKAQK